ncbi:MAG: EAL domain-containing protein [Woeseiaceae bacterium]|nr:EAL domain-containing protein [Woeseiaceae bacterium]
MRAAIRKVISLDFTGRHAIEPAPNTGKTSWHDDDDRQRTAIVVTTDKVSQQWAPRWLEHEGLQVVVVNAAEKALAYTATNDVDLLIADAGTRCQSGDLLIETINRAAKADVPKIALCASTADLTLAAETDVTDIVRKPFDWQIITQRAVGAIKAHENLIALQQANDRIDRFRISATAAEMKRAKTVGIDTLTGLPNSDRFRKLSHNAISARGNTDKQMSIVVVGLDRYRLVNEAVGHTNANRVLNLFADRLRKCISDRKVIGTGDNGTVTAIASRLGGARFAVQIANGAEEQVHRFHNAVVRELQQPFEVAGQSVYLTASFGAAIYPTQCNGPDDLLHSAETAMLEARETTGGLQFFDPLGRTSGSQLLKIDSMLRSAIPNRELELHYQPITDTRNGKVVAAEALLRWNHPVEGMIPPDAFVPVAEKTGMMVEIGKFVIRRACEQLREWIDGGMEPIRIAVNLSLCQLTRGDVVSVVAGALEKYDIDPALLEIELSERGVLNCHPEVVSEICRLKDIGVRISIDDFGTGQAAIGYLKDLPIDVIKIDRSYVSGAARSARDEAIASGMVAMAERLQATVIAEGVETTDQLQMLREWGSHECQGFLFSPAVPGDRFLEKFA